MGSFEEHNLSARLFRIGVSGRFGIGTGCSSTSKQSILAPNPNAFESILSQSWGWSGGTLLQGKVLLPSHWSALSGRPIRSDGHRNRHQLPRIGRASYRKRKKPRPGRPGRTDRRRVCRGAAMALPCLARPDTVGSGGARTGLGVDHLRRLSLGRAGMPCPMRSEPGRAESSRKGLCQPVGATLPGLNSSADI